MPGTLTKRERVEMINELSEKNKEIIRKAIMSAEENGMAGSGFWSSLGSGLKDIVIALGPALIKEVLAPIAKEKVLGKKGSGLGGDGSRLAGRPRPRGRPKKILDM